MNDVSCRAKRSRLPAAWTCAALALAAVGCAPMMDAPKAGTSPSAAVALTGANEVPPVTTSATGRSMIVVHPNRAVSGSVTTTGVNATMAHIHVGAPGANGPVIVPLARGDGGTWTVPAGAMLTEDQYASWRAGNLYVNVHSAAFPGGEIRGQLRP